MHVPHPFESRLPSTVAVMHRLGRRVEQLVLVGDEMAREDGLAATGGTDHQNVARSTQRGVIPGTRVTVLLTFSSSSVEPESNRRGQRGPPRPVVALPSFSPAEGIDCPDGWDYDGTSPLGQSGLASRGVSTVTTRAVEIHDLYHVFSFLFRLDSFYTLTRRQRLHRRLPGARMTLITVMGGIKPPH